MRQTFLTLLTVGLLVVSCTGGSKEMPQDYGSIMTAAQEVAYDETGANAKPIEVEIQDSKIVKTGRMGVRVSDLKATKSTVDTLVRKYGGYYADQNFSNSDIMLTIRVPSQNYEPLIAAIESGNGTLQYKLINTHDVTEQYLDVQTRLENKREYLKRYRELLARANSIKDVLAIEQVIRPLEEEIESAEGRLRFLNNQVAYSTLDLNISTTAKREEDRFSDRVLNALSAGWSLLLDMSLVFLTIWPLLLLAAGVIVIIKMTRAKRRKKERNM